MRWIVDGGPSPTDLGITSAVLLVLVPGGSEICRVLRRLVIPALAVFP